MANRQSFQQVANLRLEEARALLAAGFPAGAYYLAGYAVECALKACIAKGVQQYDFPDKDKVNQSYSHNLVQLVKAAGLELELTNEIKGNAPFAANWAVVQGWTPEKRYSVSLLKVDAEDMISATEATTEGVLPWLMKHW